MFIQLSGLLQRVFGAKGWDSASPATANGETNDFGEGRGPSPERGDYRFFFNFY